MSIGEDPLLRRPDKSVARMRGSLCRERITVYEVVFFERQRAMTHRRRKACLRRLQRRSRAEWPVHKRNDAEQF